ncbi:MAG: sigma-E processing peptidase SpoIIGA, partial [Evtepia sp.]
MGLLTVIYIDSFFLLNFCINYLLLLSAAKLAGEIFYRLRFALSAVFGAFYAAMTFFPVFRILVHPVFKLSAAVIMILIAFGGTRRMFRLAAIFFALSCAFGGGLLALDFFRNGSYIQNGVLHSALDFKGVLIAAGLFYGLLSLLFRRAAVHSGGELLSISFSEGEKSVKLIA